MQRATTVVAGATVAVRMDLMIMFIPGLTVAAIASLNDLTGTPQWRCDAQHKTGDFGILAARPDRARSISHVGMPPREKEPGELARVSLGKPRIPEKNHEGTRSICCRCIGCEHQCGSGAKPDNPRQDERTDSSSEHNTGQTAYRDRSRGCYRHVRCAHTADKRTGSQ